MVEVWAILMNLWECFGVVIDTYFTSIHIISRRVAENAEYVFAFFATLRDTYTQNHLIRRQTPFFFCLKNELHFKDQFFCPQKNKIPPPKIAVEHLYQITIT